ncbi:DUF1622 domain-containing protein [Caldimonas tepidiphila]|uniref:DUF1622 domain-containing protein n=1 Tax=Caldimonas tepidiphila TaxID=2315841 RepID=UPI000E5A59CA|nr:DUF1622 domain-containing protein [Caldimonas tepidiphila]
MFRQSESLAREVVEWLRLAVETLSALIIAIGVAVAVGSIAVSLLRRQGGGFNRVRLQFARYLTLALEFQLAADILSTAIAPSWEQIGKLDAIALIRTALNFFLMFEMREEARQAERESDAHPDAPRPRA